MTRGAFRAEYDIGPPRKLTDDDDLESVLFSKLVLPEAFKQQAEAYMRCKPGTKKGGKGK
jgi:hypothetical protein